MSNIIKRDPFKEIERFFDEDETFGFFPAVRRHFGPAMDVYETDSAIVAEVSVPKMDPSKIKVSVHDGILRIEGGEDETKEENRKNYHRKEIRRGHFIREVSLPAEVKEDEADASFENGTLKITIPKAEVKKPKEIEIKVK